MTFQYYGLTFRRLEHESIELLRIWRNSEWVQPFMHHREYITPQMQEKWFASINNLNNWVFTIEKENEPVGVIYLRNMDLKAGTTEPGILMARKDSALMVPAAISMMFQCEIGFNLFQLSSFVAHLYRDHSRSLSNQYHVGATIVGEFGDRSVYAETLRTNFEIRSAKVRNALKALYGEDDRIIIAVEKEKDDPDVIKFIESCFRFLEKEQIPRFELISW